MSLTNEERQTIVQRELKKANEWYSRANNNLTQYHRDGSAAPLFFYTGNQVNLKIRSCENSFIFSLFFC